MKLDGSTLVVDGLTVCGASAMIYGLWLVWPPLAWLGGGWLAVFIAWKLSNVPKSSDKS